MLLLVLQHEMLLPDVTETQLVAACHVQDVGDGV